MCGGAATVAAGHANQLWGSAVGGANGRNPIPLIVPCHRVVASDGIGGFTGGLEWKERLLVHEAAASEKTGWALGSKMG